MTTSAIPSRQAPYRGRFSSLGINLTIHAAENAIGSRTEIVEPSDRSTTQSLSLASVRKQPKWFSHDNRSTPSKETE